MIWYWLLFTQTPVRRSRLTVSTPVRQSARLEAKVPPTRTEYEEIEAKAKVRSYWVPFRYSSSSISSAWSTEVIRSPCQTDGPPNLSRLSRFRFSASDVRHYPFSFFLMLTIPVAPRVDTFIVQGVLPRSGCVRWKRKPLRFVVSVAVIYTLIRCPVDLCRMWSSPSRLLTAWQSLTMCLMSGRIILSMWHIAECSLAHSAQPYSLPCLKDCARQRWKWVESHRLLSVLLHLAVPFLYPMYFQKSWTFPWIPVYMYAIHVKQTEKLVMAHRQ